jgi:hypothetical protein
MYRMGPPVKQKFLFHADRFFSAIPARLSRRKADGKPPPTFSLYFRNLWAKVSTVEDLIMGNPDTMTAFRRHALCPESPKKDPQKQAFRPAP